MPLTDEMTEALRRVAGALASEPADWLVGGSCGLALQGVPLAARPRDLDLYADTEAAAALDKRLRGLATDEAQISRTPIYESVLSHYAIGGVTVELVGGFRVRALDSDYTVQVSGVLAPYALKAPGFGDIRLMPLAHELVFNILRGRADRYEAIAAAIRSNLLRHQPALDAIRYRNALGGPVEELLQRLLPG